MDKQVPLWWVIGASIFTLLLGSGVIWKIQESRIETAKLDLEKTRLSLDIRDRMRSMQSEIVKLLQEPNRNQQQQTALLGMIENFNAAEKALATIEGRKPTSYAFSPPSAPHNFTVK